MSAYVSRPEDCVLHEAGWLELPTGHAISRMPVWDRAAELFARMGHGDEHAGAWLAAQGLRLPTVAEYDALHAVALHIDPYTLPTEEMLIAARVPRPWIDPQTGADTPAMRAYRTQHIRTRAWCELHDARVLARLRDAGWTDQPVANAGKHWAQGGIIVGWWHRGGGRIQNPSAFHRNEPGYTDYATTYHAVRDASERPTRPGSEPPPPRVTRPGDRDAGGAGPVHTWQRWLVAHGYALPRYGIDGDHGRGRHGLPGETEAATIRALAERPELRAQRPDLYPSTSDAIPIDAAPTPALVEEGDTRTAVVARVQRIVGTTVTGSWPREPNSPTTRAVRIWQAAHGLVPDGRFGVKSWRAAGVAVPDPPKANDPRAPAILAALRDANARWPDRKKISDGTLGDLSHRFKPGPDGQLGTADDVPNHSDHNVGLAVDITHDPVSGCTGDRIAEMAITDPRVSYVIWNRRIWNRLYASAGWRPHSGKNGHTHHVHISVRVDMRHDARPWPWAQAA